MLRQSTPEGEKRRRRNRDGGKNGERLVCYVRVLRRGRRGGEEIETGGKNGERLHWKKKSCRQRDGLRGSEVLLTRQSMKY